MILQSLETAINEITLVLFTTLAPSGIFAFMIAGLFVMFTKLDGDLIRSLILSNIITLVGLVASATHLGNPANALYVLMRVGQSPLSTEVFAVILFLLSAGTYWLYSFTLKPKVILQKIWMGVAVLLGALAITAIAIAYNVETISTWNTIYVPINLWLNAVVGGSLMALLTLQIGQAPDLDKSRLAKVLCMFTGFGTAANAISMLMQDAMLPTLTNAFGSAADLVPFYKIVIALFIVLALAATLIYALKLFSHPPKLPDLPLACIACGLVLLAIFLTRFTFYMMHMTVGPAL